MSQSFDRMRARAGAEPLSGHVAVQGVDVQGKAALFSSAVPIPSLGSVAITCSACQQASVVSYVRAVQLAVPSIHLLGLRRQYPSWMRCPACQQRTWVRITLS